MKILTIGLLALMAGFADQATLAAQEARPIPTPASALANMREARNVGDAVDVLTQLHGYRPESELDAFADSLVVLANEYESDPGRSLRPSPALLALVESALPEKEGAIPYPGAYEALERVFAATQSRSALAFMAEADPRRALPLLRERVVASDEEVACPANDILSDIDGGEELLRQLTNSGTLVHECRAVHGHPLIFLDPIEPQLPPPFSDILKTVQAGDPAASQQAVDILTGVGEWRHPGEQLWLADSLATLASSGGGESPVAVRAWEILERSAHPTDPDVLPYPLAYEAVMRVFEATGSQEALESLARIDAGHATSFLAEVAGRDAAVSCTARAVLVQMNDGPRLLRELEDAGRLTYRCPGGM